MQPRQGLATLVPERGWDPQPEPMRYSRFDYRKPDRVGRRSVCGCVCVCVCVNVCVSLSLSLGWVEELMILLSFQPAPPFKLDSVPCRSASCLASIPHHLYISLHALRHVWQSIVHTISPLISLFAPTKRASPLALHTTTTTTTPPFPGRHQLFLVLPPATFNHTPILTTAQHHTRDATASFAPPSLGAIKHASSTQRPSQPTSLQQ